MTVESDGLAARHRIQSAHKCIFSTRKICLNNFEWQKRIWRNYKIEIAPKIQKRDKKYVWRHYKGSYINGSTYQHDRWAWQSVQSLGRILSFCQEMRCKSTEGSFSSILLMSLSRSGLSILAPSCRERDPKSPRIPLSWNYKLEDYPENMKIQKYGR